MTTWTTPTIFSQYAELGGEDIHITWINVSDNDSLDRRPLQTSKSLSHIARSPRTDLIDTTYYIRATGFNFNNLPEIVQGIELRITARRGGRVSDDTIQLCLNNALIGENQATIEVAPILCYGNSTFLWAANELTSADLHNPTFGVDIRFKSHPQWPHRDAASIDAIEMRIY
jgi:hypothetical protein